ncbi:MAG: YkgJ family cysteine cluster protein [Candidatus Lokiarchaeota archaeon]|nr:YkgJ family cysteine cluster protein [Candidatus Lokiarchaeota archaeon]
MTDPKYKCMKCGTCCFINLSFSNEEYLKRIPLYPEEVDRLIEIAKKRQIPLKVKEDLVFPDILNKKILVLTYRFLLNENGHCVFYDPKIGCTVHEIKPFACQAYPLALKRIDAFNLEMIIDSTCNWVEEHHNRLKNIDFDKMKIIFSEGFKNAEAFLKKNKKLQLQIRRLEAENKIKIARQISIEDYSEALNKWKRKEIRSS